MAILDHMGKKSSFLPPEMHSYPSPHGEGVMLSSSKCTFPKMQYYKCTLPPPNLFHLYVGKDFSPLKCKTHTKCFPTNSYFSCDFYLFIVFFFLSFFFSLLFPLIFPFFPPPPPKKKPWISSPKWKNYSPAFGANKRRIDAPAWSTATKFMWYIFTCTGTLYIVRIGFSGSESDQSHDYLTWSSS